MSLGLSIFDKHKNPWLRAWGVDLLAALSMCRKFLIKMKCRGYAQDYRAWVPVSID